MLVIKQKQEYIALGYNNNFFFNLQQVSKCIWHISPQKYQNLEWFASEIS